MVVLEREWVNVFLQGADVVNGQVRLTGSYNIVSLGKIRIDDLYRIIDELVELTRKGYPQHLVARDDFCLASVTAEAGGRIVTIWFPEEGDPQGFVWNEADGWEYEFSMRDTKGIKASIRRYLIGEDVEAPPLINPVYSIRVINEETGDEKIILIDLGHRKLAGISLDSIRYVETIRGGILRRTPRLRITYINSGSIRVVDYRLASKQTLDRDIEALRRALGPNRVKEK